MRRIADGPGTVAEWEEWTGLASPESDRYVVPGALEPITIDREADRGTYVEPNDWVLHRTVRPPRKLRS